MSESTQPAQVGSHDGLGLVERLRQERRPTAWTRGVDTDYPTAWEPNLLAHEAAQEIERLRAEVGAKQAQIDRLMLEHCPDEMTPAQLIEWGLHQQPAHTDHPARHYDRTCPGCADEPNARVQTTGTALGG